MKINAFNIGGDVVKEDDRYVVKDNKTLNNLVLSSTDLQPTKSTSGHAHKGQEEVYHFIKGSGKMELIDTDGKHHDRYVSAGDIVLIQDGWFHRVHAGPHGAYFV